jgi:AraC-like DNA-binding protein
LRDGQTDDLLAQINILFDRQRSIYAGSERLQMMFVELLSVLSRLARKEHIDTYELFSERDIYSKMRYMTIDEMKQFFIDAYSRFTELRASHSGESSRELTQQACSFIRHNYKKPISLIDVADSVGVTPSYLSRIFKADTGKTVVEYINKARIEAAIRMIDDGVQLKGLAERVGFNSSNYFITVFRQATGKTPMQYRKTHNAV